jgi:hypothetical protein
VRQADALSRRIEYLTKNTESVLHVGAGLQIQVDIGGVAVFVEVAEAKQCAALNWNMSLSGW